MKEKWRDVLRKEGVNLVYGPLGGSGKDSLLFPFLKSTLIDVDEMFEYVIERLYSVFFLCRAVSRHQLHEVVS